MSVSTRTTTMASRMALPRWVRRFMMTSLAAADVEAVGAVVGAVRGQEDGDGAHVARRLGRLDAQAVMAGRADPVASVERARHQVSARDRVGHALVGAADGDVPQPDVC